MIVSESFASPLRSSVPPLLRREYAAAAGIDLSVVGSGGLGTLRGRRSVADSVSGRFSSSNSLTGLDHWGRRWAKST